MSLPSNSSLSLSDSLVPVSRKENNDLTLSVRNSRNNKTVCCSDLFDLNSHEQMGLNDSRNKQFSNTCSGVLIESSETGSERTEAKSLNHSDVYLHEDPRMYLLSDVQISNRIETVVDELYESMLSGLSQGSVSTVKTPIVNGDPQNLPRTSVEHCDLKPSYRLEMSEKIGKNLTKPCFRKKLPGNFKNEIMNHERSIFKTMTSFNVNDGEIRDEIPHTSPQISMNPSNTVETNCLVQPRKKRVSLPLECSTSIVSHRNSFLSCEGKTVTKTESLDMCAKMKNAKKIRKTDLEMCLSPDNELIPDIERTKSNSKKRKHSIFSIDTMDNGKRFKKKTEANVDEKNKSLQLSRKRSEMKGRHCVNGKLTFKKTLHSKQNKIESKKNSFKFKLNTPSKSLLMIQNVHRKIARSGEFKLSDLGNEENNEDVLSKLHDIVPLQPVIHRPVRSLRSCTINDKHTLHRKVCTDGIWNSVNSTY